MILVVIVTLLVFLLVRINSTAFLSWLAAKLSKLETTPESEVDQTSVDPH